MPFTVLGQWKESKQAVSAITDIDTKYLSWDSPKDNLETTLRCKSAQQINCSQAFEFESKQKLT